MTASRDKFGRPIVVVTGMGIVTSLGAGKTDNWAKLTAGESGIRTITRFPIDGLKTTMAGTVDFVESSPARRPGFRSVSPKWPPKKLSSSRVSAAKAIFRDRCFSPWRRSKSNGRNGWNWDAPSGAKNSTTTICSASAAAADYTPYHRRFLFGSVADLSRRYFRHQGIADFAVDRLRVRRHLDPARRRSHPPRRDRRGALRGDRRFGQSGSVGPVFPFVGTVDPERSAPGRVQAVFEEPRRIRHGGRRRRAGAGKL